MLNVKSTVHQAVLPVFDDGSSNITCDQGGVNSEDRKSARTERQNEEKANCRRLYVFALMLLPLLSAGAASAQQYPLVDEVANRVVQKYQNSSCEQLWQKRGQPQSPREQEAVEALRNNPQMRQAFIDRVAAPIANKMFECGLIP
jgi:hypothetical protein